MTLTNLLVTLFVVSATTSVANASLSCRILDSAYALADMVSNGFVRDVSRFGVLPKTQVVSDSKGRLEIRPLPDEKGATRRLGVTAGRKSFVIEDVIAVNSQLKGPDGRSYVAVLLARGGAQQLGVLDMDGRLYQSVMIEAGDRLSDFNFFFYGRAFREVKSIFSRVLMKAKFSNMRASS